MLKSSGYKPRTQPGLLPPETENKPTLDKEFTGAFYQCR